MLILFSQNVKLRRYPHHRNGIWRAGGRYSPELKGRRSAVHQEDAGIWTCDIIQTISLRIMSQFPLAHLLSLLVLSLLTRLLGLIPTPQRRIQDCPGLQRIECGLTTPLSAQFQLAIPKFPIVRVAILIFQLGSALLSLWLEVRRMFNQRSWKPFSLN